MSARSATPRARRPGRRLPDRPRELRGARPLGDRPRPAAARLRLAGGISATTPWSPANGARPTRSRTASCPEILLGGKYGRRLHFWDLHKRKHLQEIDFGAEQQLVFELRPAHDPTKAYGFVNVRHQPQGSLLVDLDLVPRRRQVGGQEDHRDPGRARRSRSAAAGAQGLQGGAAAGHRHRPLDGRPLPLRVLLGHRRPAPVRRVRSVQPQAHRQGADRRHRRARRASRANRTGHSTAARRWSRSAATASGSTSPTRSTARSTRSSIRTGSTAGWSSSMSSPSGGIAFDPNFFIDWPKGHRPHQIRLEGGDCSSDSYCYPVIKHTAWPRRLSARFAGRIPRAHPDAGAMLCSVASWRRPSDRAFCQGQVEIEGRPLPLLGGEANAASMGLDDRFADAEPEPYPAHSSR